MVDGSHVGDASSYTFTNVTDDHTIEVTFKNIPENPTGIEVVFAHQLKIFPNPAQTEITIESGDLNIEYVGICDLSGRRMLYERFSPVNGSLKINVSGLPQGVYFLKVYTGKDFVVSKFVKE